MGYVVLLLIAAVLGFAAGWMLRGWGLDGSTRMSDGYEREQREILSGELNTARAERDDARTQMLTMRAAIPCAPGAAFKRDAAVPAPSPARVPPSPAPASSVAAAAMASAGTMDDLQRIKGIGPKAQQSLAAMGVTRFAQIAAWSDEEAAEFNAKLRARGRIERDRWIAQARALAGE
jgi:predicted flap endonuclease-1-like 5' DNA nuclease